VVLHHGPEEDGAGHDEERPSVFTGFVGRYPFGQPRTDAQCVAVVQRLSDEQLSERKPGERDGAGSLRAAA
jgi:hypothetical protein